MLGGAKRGSGEGGSGRGGGGGGGRGRGNHGEGRRGNRGGNDSGGMNHHKGRGGNGGRENGDVNPTAVTTATGRGSTDSRGSRGRGTGSSRRRGGGGGGRKGVSTTTTTTPSRAPSGRDENEEGEELPIPPGVEVFHLKSEVGAEEATPLEIVLRGDTERERLENELESIVGEEGAEESSTEASPEDVANRMEEICTRLEELEVDTAESRAGRILFGLGFDADMQRRPASSFSGGWRMRISLAQGLFRNPGILLLDEPTNHLDIEACVWLEKYLQGRKDSILLLVSHSQDFLNNVCNQIIHMARGKLSYYEGNYDQYVRTRAEKEIHQHKNYVREQNQIASMKDYIARFGHGSRKLARQAQSKEKTLAKMQSSGLTEKVVSDRVISFDFPSRGPLPPPVLQFTEVSFKYPRQPTLLLENLNFGMDLDTRVAICGPNGAGKTTLTKLMLGELEPTQGVVTKKGHLRVARYHQHLVDICDLAQSPLGFLKGAYPEYLTPEPLRGALGRFGVSGSLQTQPMETLSHGQRARVMFAWMALTTPHMLVLDEPTNNLDMESIDALAGALNRFEGAVVVVSHDLRLIAQIAEEIWVVEKQKVTKFAGDIADYKAHVERRIATLSREFERKLKQK